MKKKGEKELRPLLYVCICIIVFQLTNDDKWNYVSTLSISTHRHLHASLVNNDNHRHVLQHSFTNDTNCTAYILNCLQTKKLH